MLAFTLVIAGRGDEARAAADGLVEPAEATGNPLWFHSRCSPTASPSATRLPTGALEAMRRGLAIAQDSGSRVHRDLAGARSGRLEARVRRPAGRARLHRVGRSATTTTLATPPDPCPSGDLARLFDRLGRYEPAVTIAGFAFNSLTAAWVPAIRTAIVHLREVLGDEAYEGFTRKGETMTTTEMVTYAYDQMDQARAELNAVSI